MKKLCIWITHFRAKILVITSNYYAPIDIVSFHGDLLSNSILIVFIKGAHKVLDLLEQQTSGVRERSNQDGD
jgi:hypothetical protein